MRFVLILAASACLLSAPTPVSGTVVPCEGFAPEGETCLLVGLAAGTAGNLLDGSIGGCVAARHVLAEVGVPTTALDSVFGPIEQRTGMCSVSYCFHYTYKGGQTDAAIVINAPGMVALTPEGLLGQEGFHIFTALECV
jgi:hypothetical protein